MVRITSNKLSDVLRVCEVVRKVRDNVCRKLVSESNLSFGKSVDRIDKNFENIESHTAEGDLVGGLVKGGRDRNI